MNAVYLILSAISAAYGRLTHVLKQYLDPDTTLLHCNILEEMTIGLTEHVGSSVADLSSVLR